jgi:luciferase family oxidoreductase group 1
MSTSAFLAKPQLSVLDFGIIAPGNNGPAVVRETFDLATAAERLGYSGFWLSEHHEKHFAWVGPAAMIGAIAQRTRHIRIGAAAILLPLYSPLTIAESFRTLAALTPGRIELGVCAGIPLDEMALAALVDAPIEQARAAPATFGRKLTDLDAYLNGRFPAGHRFAAGASPVHAPAPPLWIMGSSENSALRAAQHRAGFAYSLFHRGSGNDAAVTMAYRDAVSRNAGSDTGRINIAATCICAEDAEAVAAQCKLVARWLNNDMRISISGTPQQCREQIAAVAERYGADEITLFHLWHEPEPRLAALGALAAEFGLQRRSEQ